MLSLGGGKDDQGMNFKTDGGKRNNSKLRQPPSPGFSAGSRTATYNTRQQKIIIDSFQMFLSSFD
jgi:hypothetical protein